jgi:hypothetical protein
MTTATKRRIASSSFAETVLENEEERFLLEHYDNRDNSLSASAPSITNEDDEHDDHDDKKLISVSSSSLLSVFRHYCCCCLVCSKPRILQQQSNCGYYWLFGCYCVMVFLVTSGLVCIIHWSFQWAETTWLNPIVRISSSISTIAANTAINNSSNNILRLEEEETLDGKFCDYRHGRWHCQECYWGKCHALITPDRRFVCPPFSRQEWDEPYPQSKSYYDPSHHHHHGHNNILPFRLLTRFGISKAWRIEYEQPVCTIASCFNLTKCAATLNGPLTIYSKPSNIPTLLQQLLRNEDDDTNHINNTHHHKKSRRYQLVQDPNEACLMVVFPQQYSSHQEFITSSHWNQGRNHFIWNAACHVFPFDATAGKDWFCDQPFSNLHYGLAALAHTQLTLAHVRLGYDVPLPLPRHWKRPVPLYQVPLASQRPVLLSFRGSIQDTLQPYYQHRWLAAEYWKEDPDVTVNAQCVHRRKVVLWGGDQNKNQILRPYDNERWESSFDYLLLNSTFVFAPGGSGVNTYRFGEALSAGAIPVVTPDFVPPLVPELDWSPCLVVVSESRIVDLPRILRQDYPFQPHTTSSSSAHDVDASHHGDTMPHQHPPQESINRRQKACLDLLQASMGEKYYQHETATNNDGDSNGRSGGWLHDDQVVFEQGMDIMRMRIMQAVQYQEKAAKEILYRKKKPNTPG